MEDQNTIPEDDMFVIHISESMELRNSLRSGLVKAQSGDTGKAPMLVSWPRWLDDGIVCLYARDLNNLLNTAIQRAVIAVGAVQGEDESASADVESGQMTEDGEFHMLDPGGLERVEQSEDTDEKKQR